ncbi:hypothetical protein [Actinopolymorpha pittospori]|jgi:hypothetical protein|uniref:Uncharacterized protein n=1 Tax=Actinopolymorpha pittospori TaxID=648752 RepID=A0A927MVV9_9ACTN|nr:hypothetical protein [Actinopolymorpha pittospori]MBE1607865.1 hypothetical protein [Actinopolymorpha pittospori]
MTDVFGPNTRGVLHLISHLNRLDGAQIDTVVARWRQQSGQVRARAWNAIGAATTSTERRAVLDAAVQARRDAMDVARRHDRSDWAFWAAAWDAAAAVAAGDRLDERHHRLLVEPISAALPWVTGRLSEEVGSSGLQAAIAEYGGRDD